MRSTRPRRTARTTATALGAAVLLALTGCGTSDADADTAAGETVDRVDPIAEGTEPGLPATVTDATGAAVTIASADAIVPLSGSLSEIVFTLGLGDRVVARDITATFEQAADLPIVSHGHDISAEGVLSLQPDLVLAETGSGPQTALDQIAAAGVPIVVFDPADGIDAAAERITAVAAAFGVPDLGAQLVERTEAGIAAATEGLDLSDPPRVAFLYLRGSASVYMIGARDSGAASLIEAAGGIDAGAEALEGDFIELTPEALAAAAPDVILVMDKGLDSVGGVEGLLELPGVAQTPAGENERIAHLPDGIMLNYGPRTGDIVADLARQLHGEPA
ncbi:iron complex transport system substrate-binding protein [Glycomyces sambucus]|uniref:Iron complex transport system substrate-binding protein n=1 Tax=Glycomyces sambucus TaxID=380244 RepID=A0A1G9ERZ7_9ACTN|nr:ABC transporter substrate-binding protein [Glycomyces sambucus]SDK78833.1 iron complex transport system substrate-binding protein [Glycomyces sambucus]